MELKPLEFCTVSPTEPPSFEQCASVVSPKADYVISPLAMAALFGWDEDEDN